MALFVLSLCPLDISVGVGAFVMGLSQISSFFSLNEGGDNIIKLIKIQDKQIKNNLCKKSSKIGF